MESYCIYSDESGSQSDQYHSIGALSGSKKTLKKLRNKLDNILKDINTSKVEFKQLKGDYKKESAAKEYIIKSINYCHKDKIRIDILSWDTQDDRHDIFKRDDQKNFERMYYHLIKWVNAQYVPVNPDWEFYPDQKNSINWEKLNYFVESTNLSKNQPDTLFKNYNLPNFPNIEKFRESISDNNPLTQLIDIYTGLGRLSIKKGSKFIEWKKIQEKKDKNQMMLFDSSVNNINVSRGEESKFKILYFLIKNCKKHKMGVSINSNSYLYTYQPTKYNINYWFYEPQGNYDKAPTK